MIKDNRMKRVGVPKNDIYERQRAPSSNLDIIHRNQNADVEVLYNDDVADSNLPSIHGS